MRHFTLVARGLRHHWRDHLGLLLAVGTGAAVLTGALIVGDSARHTLRRGALLRLGRTNLALVGPGTGFASALAERLEHRLGVPVAPLLREPAVAVLPGGERRRQLGGIRVYGVDGRFARFASPGAAAQAPSPRSGEVALGRALAAALGIGPGERVSLRFAAPSRLPRDAPLAEAGGPATLLGTATVAAVVPDEALGSFGLESSMRPPHNAFVELGWLQRLLGREGSANLLVVAEVPDDASAERAQRALREVFLPGMAGLQVRDAGDVSLLESERVFLEPAVSAAALATPGAVGALTYLVNGISVAGAGGSRGTPYSFVAALSPSADPALGPVPEGMRDDEILLNGWSAERLGVGPGERVELAYSVPLAGGGFEERRRAFTVRALLPMERLAAEASLVPEFPGLTDVESCRDWRIGLPLDERLLRDEPNEEYWRRYRATPKAFVTLAAGKAMWANRWGDLTAARFPRGALPRGADSLAARVDPAALGLVFAPAREEALRSVARATDLGGLFLGMSLFLLASALVLAGLLFAFGVERRAGETGTLLALGFTPARVAAAYFAEATLVAAAGAAAGAVAGTWYAGALLGRLQASWSGAVAGLEILRHAGPWTAPAGAAGAFLAAIAAVAIALRRQLRTPARELLAGADADGAAPAASVAPSRLLPAAAAVAAAAAAALLARSAAAGADPAASFFAAGTLLLLAALSAARSILARLDRPLAGALTEARLCARSVARRPGRSLAVFSLLAAGGFTVFAAAAMRADPDGATGRSSGGGGFALVGETSLPLRAGEAEEALRRARAGPLDAGVLALKVRGGDDASCFNLNRAGAPRLVGVDPEAFFVREAFVPPGKGREVWRLLSRELPPGVVPGLVGDGDTARWNLRVRTGAADGDEVEYRDERGESFRVRLVGALPVRKSVFQGTILIPIREFAQRFPAEDGFRMLLLEAPPARVGALRETLERELGRLGLELRTPAERLAEFSAVEHAYQRMFLALGGLGLLLGTVGLAVVVLRNVLERSAELALLAALGLSRLRIALILGTEHLALFAAGIGAGMLAALVAVLPALTTPGAGVPVGDLAGLALALFAAGLACVLAAVALGARRPVLAALRRE